MFYQDIRISTKTSSQMRKVLAQIEHLLMENEDVFDFEYENDYEDDD